MNKSTLEARKIDLTGYRQSGEGANGASYDSISDPDVMVKLYNADYPVQPIFDELEVARKVYELGVPSPEPGEIVTDGTRLGIRFRRIRGKRSFSRMLADEPGRTEEYSRELARFCKKLHSVECPPGVFPDAKEQFRQMLAQISCFSVEEKAFLSGLIDEMPDATTALHGDMHMGNVITTLPAGAPLSAPHETYFIDLGYFAQGHPVIDLGMMANICDFSDADFIMHDMHITKEHAAMVYDYFLDEYFFADDKIAEKWYGAGQTLDSIKEKLGRSYCIKAILITFNLGFKLPEFDRQLHALMG